MVFASALTGDANNICKLKKKEEKNAFVLASREPIGDGSSGQLKGTEETSSIKLDVRRKRWSDRIKGPWFLHSGHSRLKPAEIDIFLDELENVHAIRPTSVSSFFFS